MLLLPLEIIILFFGLLQFIQQLHNVIAVERAIYAHLSLPGLRIFDLLEPFLFCLPFEGVYLLHMGVLIDYKLSLLVLYALHGLLKPAVEEGNEDVILLDIPFEFVVHVFLFLYPLLHVSADFLCLALEMGGRFVFEHAVAVSQLHRVVFVLLDASFGFVLHLSEEVHRFCSGDISLLSCLEGGQLVVQLENSAL